MRFSRYYLPTLKETPGDAELVSHQLMVRAGMMRKVAAGIYDLLPYGLAAVRRVETIVREEMNRAGALEIQMPGVQPAELWRESGRWPVMGKELLKFKDRHDRDFCLGPTHEEIVTDIVRRDVHSYRQLPLNLYQIQFKFRDEIRPRFGLMRGREFTMKDAYSFDLDEEGAKKSFDAMYDAYTRIFERCGLNFRPVEAATGNIGGHFSYEFMVLADSGEDRIVACTGCDYAANTELAEIGKQNAATPPIPADAPTPERVETPKTHTVEAIAEYLKIPASRILKTIVFQSDAGPVAALVRGDHEVNVEKLAKLLGVPGLELADDETIRGISGARKGFSGPMGLHAKLIADHAVAGMGDMAVGANENDAHLVHVFVNRDFTPETFADIRTAAGGDPCPRCATGTLEEMRGIEVGQVFMLGTKYSEAMNATVLDADKHERTLIMGCYGIGIGRTLAAAIEQHHDDNGMCLPVPLAPFRVIIVPTNLKDDRVREASEKLYAHLENAGGDVLLDDRDERAGAKFADADLLGAPVRITLGPRGLKEGQCEVKLRTTADAENVALDDVVDHVQGLIADA